MVASAGTEGQRHCWKERKGKKGKKGKKGTRKDLRRDPGIP
jgi:hypothetical protein